MDQNTLEAISITALVIAVIIFMILILRWVVKKWFAGSWADKIIGGKRMGKIYIFDDDINKFKEYCERLQDCIISGVAITESDMTKMVNVIYLAIGATDSQFNVAVKPLKKDTPKTRQALFGIIEDGLVSAPLTALLLTATPYMFTKNIRKEMGSESFCEMLNRAYKRDKEPLNLLFNAICDKIHEVNPNITKNMIQTKWSDSDVSLLNVSMMFSLIIDNGSFMLTAENVAKALEPIVIPPVYEAIISNGDSITGDTTIGPLYKVYG